MGIIPKWNKKDFWYGFASNFNPDLSGLGKGLGYKLAGGPEKEKQMKEQQRLQQWEDWSKKFNTEREAALQDWKTQKDYLDTIRDENIKQQNYDKSLQDAYAAMGIISSQPGYNPKKYANIVNALASKQASDLDIQALINQAGSIAAQNEALKKQLQQQQNLDIWKQKVNYKTQKKSTKNVSKLETDLEKIIADLEPVKDIMEEIGGTQNTKPHKPNPSNILYNIYASYKNGNKNDAAKYLEQIKNLDVSSADKMKINRAIDIINQIPFEQKTYTTDKWLLKKKSFKEQTEQIKKMEKMLKEYAKKIKELELKLSPGTKTFNQVLGSPKINVGGGFPTADTSYDNFSRMAP